MGGKTPRGVCLHRKLQIIESSCWCLSGNDRVNVAMGYRYWDCELAVHMYNLLMMLVRNCCVTRRNVPTQGRRRWASDDLFLSDGEVGRERNAAFRGSEFSHLTCSDVSLMDANVQFLKRRTAFSYEVIIVSQRRTDFWLAFLNNRSINPQKMFFVFA